jgi:hypothetical protein
MLIILTPRVIRSAADGERIKQAEFARMNWCAADVYELYGDPGLSYSAGLSIPTEDVGTEVIYPDKNPRGERITPEGALLEVPHGTPTPTPAARPLTTPTPASPRLHSQGENTYGPQQPNAWNDPRR